MTVDERVRVQYSYASGRYTIFTAETSFHQQVESRAIASWWIWEMPSLDFPNSEGCSCQLCQHHESQADTHQGLSSKQ